TRVARSRREDCCCKRQSQAQSGRHEAQPCPRRPMSKVKDQPAQLTEITRTGCDFVHAPPSLALNSQRVQVTSRRAQRNALRGIRSPGGRTLLDILHMASAPHRPSRRLDFSSVACLRLQRKTAPPACPCYPR